MPKFNNAAAATIARSPVTSEHTPAGVTYEGGAGWARDAKSELFLLAVTNMGSEDTFYESARQRDSRFSALIRQVAIEDPAWVAGFLPWLRGEANMRTASLIGAAEFVVARKCSDTIPGASGRQVVASVLQRADEPGELIAYWHSLHGRAEPKPLKRGIADAILRLYTEYALLKYDTASHGYRFGDVIERVHVTGEHPEVKGTWRGDLYEHAIDRRHNRDNPVPESLTMIRANAALRNAASVTATVLLDQAALKAAGMTWEDALSLAGTRLPKDQLWAALIPSMGYMALLRNLRNFDEAGVPDDVAGQVAAQLADPEQVARSRQFPFRFLAAYRAAPSLRWAYPLEKALNLSLANVPALDGDTLVLTDRSLSMWGAKMSSHSTMLWADAGAVFAAGIAARAQRADLVEFSSRSARVEFRAGESVLKVVEKFHKGDNSYAAIGSGTDIPRAVKEHLRPAHTRVVIVTDEQSEPGVLASNMHGHYYGDAEAMPPTGIDDLIPRSVPVYIWNFGGYRHGTMPSGGQNRHTFGGLSDASFRLIPLLEAGRDAGWPWE